MGSRLIGGAGTQQQTLLPAPAVQLNADGQAEVGPDHRHDPAVRLLGPLQMDLADLRT